MNTTAVLDDYLGELLLDAAAATPAATVAAEPAVAAPPSPSTAAQPPAPAPGHAAAPVAPPAAATAPSPAPIAVAAAAAPTPRPAAAQPSAPAWQPPPDVRPQEAAPSPRSGTDHSSRWLRLRCGDQAYALELLKVQEVVLPAPLLPLRGAAPSMLGVMNLRGQVVPVIDLGLHLGAAAIDSDLQTRIVVLEEDGESLGLRVSAVEDVASLPDQQIEPPDNARICRISNNLFRGVARTGKHPVILLDASQLLH